MNLVPWRRTFGPGVLLKASQGEFCYRQDDGRVEACKCSLYWNASLEGKHYDWLKLYLDVGWIQRIKGKETVNGKA